MNMSLRKDQLILAVGVVLLLPIRSGAKDIIYLPILASLILLGLYLIWRMPKPAKFTFDGIVWPAVGIFTWSVLSLIWTVNRYQTINWVIILFLMAGMFTIATQFDQKMRDWWLKGYLAVAAIFSIFGFYIFLTGAYGRMTSSFYWPNPWAAYLIPAVIIAGWRWTEGKEKFYLYTGILVGAGFFLTFSRTSLLMVLGALAYFLWTSKKDARFWWRLGLLLVSVWTITGLVNSYRVEVKHFVGPNTARINKPQEDQQTQLSVTDRIYYVRSAFEIWRDRPVLGSGGGTYAAMHPQYQYRVVSASSHAHNFYAMVASELGVIGVGLILWLLWELFRLVLGSRRHNPELYPVAIGLMVLLVHMATDIDSSYPVIMLLVAGLAGLIYQPGGTKQGSNYSGKLLGAHLVVLVLVLSLFTSHLAAINGKAWQELGDYDKATEFYSQASSGWVHNPDVITAEGINRFTLAGLGKDKDNNLKLAGDLALEASRQDPRDAQHYQLLGRVLDRQKHSEGAEVAFKQALILDEYNHPDYYTDLAYLYLRQGKLEAALAILDKGAGYFNGSTLPNRGFIPGFGEKTSEMYMMRSRVYLAMGNAGAAEHAKEEADYIKHLYGKSGVIY